MKRNLFKFLLWAVFGLTILLMTVTTIITVSAEETNIESKNAEIVDAGYCGNDTSLVWKFYDNGLLSIEGGGNMNVYVLGSAPWYKYRDSITSIIVNDNVISISKGAFYGCNSTKEIVLPFVGESRTATGIGGTFGYIFGYETMWISGSEVYEISNKYSYAGYHNGIVTLRSSNGQTYEHSTTPIYYESDCRAKLNEILTSYSSKVYFSRGYVEGTEFLFHRGVTSYYYYIPSELKVVTITDAQCIADDAFRGWNKITHINLNDEITKIGAMAFADCTSLTSFNLPDNLVSIDKSAMSNWGYAFTVIFENYDGSVISTRTYQYGDYLICPVTTPKRSADNIYTYTFSGWNGNVPETCCGHATYTATYTPTYIDYTVSFLDADGSAISTDTYHYGDIVSIPSSPTKKGDNTYTYTFSGWGDNVPETCCGHATYTATYTPTYIDYTVSFLDADGSVISTDTYHYEDTVTVPSNPTKRGDNTYTYTFVGWDKEIGKCTGNETYTATYTSTYVDYTIVFKNYNDDVISSKTYHYGDAVVVPGAPKKPSDENYYYVFVGWDKSVTNCYGNAEYIAQFTSKNLPQVVVNDNSARAGETVTIDIVLSGAPNLASLAASNIMYDTTMFEFLGFEWKPEGAILSNWDASKGKGALAYSSATNLNGTIISIQLKVKDEAVDGEYTISCLVTSAESAFQNVAGKITIYSFTPGDVDGNESVDKDDAIYLLMHSFFPEDYPINQEADYNGNGMVDKDDAIYLLMYTFFPDDYPLAPAPAVVTLTPEESKKENEE